VEGPPALRWQSAPGSLYYTVAMKRALFGSILLMTAAIAWAQADPQAALSPRRIMLRVSRAPDAMLTEADTRLLASSLLIRLQAASAEYALTESDAADGDDSRLAAAAEAAHADAWIAVRAAGSWEELTLSVRSFDLLSRAAAFELAVKRAGWTSAGDLSLEAWDDIAGPVKGHFHRVAAAQAAVVVRPTALITVTAAPGTVVTGLGEPLAIDASGTTSRERPIMREYTLRASLEGRQFEKRSVFLTEDRTVSFTQPAVPRWNAGLSLWDRAHPGVDLAWHYVPGFGFVRLGVTTLLAGIALDGSEVISSQPLTEATLGAGWYLTRERTALKVYAGLAGFVRVVHEPGAAPTVDALSPGGFMAAIGAELPLSARTRLFFEYTPTQYFTALPALFKASLSGGSSSAGWVYSTGAAANLLSARLGIRWAP
jgi:hypothetical protein